MTGRRRVAGGACAAMAGVALAGAVRSAGAAEPFPGALPAVLAELERASGGRLGIAVLDTATGALAGHRAEERFPMCSTFKLLASAAVLARVDAGAESLDRHVRFGAGDLVVYSPATKDRVGGEGMSLAELCEAAMTLSDNTAASLLLASIGGPDGLTAYARSLGDAATRLDRVEPELNEALPDDPRDTTTPAAMLANIRALALGTALSAASRDRLVAWLLGNTTGDTRIRAGLPEGWRVGDKTGSGERGTANDVGVLWPPRRSPVLLAVYLTGTAAPAERRNATIAAVGRAVAEAVAG